VSGYLQRLAGNVLNPGVAIHPIVGSIFAAPKPGVPIESLGTEESLSPGKGPGDIREFVPQVTVASPRDIRRRTAVNTIEHEQPSSLAATSAGNTRSHAVVDDNERGQPSSLVATPEPGAGSVLAIGPRTRNEMLGTTSSKGAHEGDPQLEPAASVRETEIISAKRLYAPLIIGVFPPPNPSAAAVGYVKKSNTDYQPFELPRATDDIEIHIGRIEVTALQAAPARVTPAKPQRRGPSLEEYLKRRDGRTS
jgi:hypothetical protein